MVIPVKLAESYENAMKLPNLSFITEENAPKEIAVMTDENGDIKHD